MEAPADFVRRAKSARTRPRETLRKPISGPGGFQKNVFNTFWQKVLLLMSVTWALVTSTVPVRCALDTGISFGVTSLQISVATNGQKLNNITLN